MRKSASSSDLEHGLTSARDDLGIEKLRQKLSRNLLACIKKDLPKLIDEMEIKLGHCNSLVAQLGDGRETEGEQRGYIASVTTRLRRLIEAALDGDYHKADFVDFVKEANVSQAKKLRDLITCDSEDFASDLRLNGRLFNVVEDSSTNDVG